jgi:diamine N-acetyltransferase
MTHPPAPLSCSTPAFTIEALSSNSPKVATLANLGYHTFLETFGPFQAPEVIHPYLEQAFTLEQIQKELSDPNNRFYLLSSPTGQAVGYAKLVLRPAETHACLAAGKPMLLNRFYFSKEAQGTGAAQTLLQVCIQAVQEAGATSLWLGVWKQNHKAIRFYQKHGFQVVGTRWFQMGTVQEEDHLMELSLS